MGFENIDQTDPGVNRKRRLSGIVELAKVPDQDFYKDRKFCDILEALSLEYLKTHDSEWFGSQFNGEVSSGGYLLDTKGKETNFLPSQNISRDFDKVFAEAKQKYLETYPEEAKRFRR